jgi:hypothetical protein
MNINSATINKMENQLTSTINKMENQLKIWDAQVKFFEEKTENNGSRFKLQRAGEINELHKKQHAETEKLKEMKKATNEALEQVRGPADKIWDDLKTGIAKAHSSIN